MIKRIGEQNQIYELLPDMNLDEIQTMLKYYEFMKDHGKGEIVAELCDAINSHLRMRNREDKLKELGI